MQKGLFFALIFIRQIPVEEGGTKLLQEEEGGGGGTRFKFSPPIAKRYLESWPEEEGFYIIFISSLTSGVVGTILIEIATINIKGLSVRNTQ